MEPEPGAPAQESVRAMARLGESATTSMWASKRQQRSCVGTHSVGPLAGSPGWRVGANVPDVVSQQKGESGSPSQARADPLKVGKWDSPGLVAADDSNEVKAAPRYPRMKRTRQKLNATRRLRGRPRRQLKANPASLARTRCTPPGLSLHTQVAPGSPHRRAVLPEGPGWFFQKDPVFVLHAKSHPSP